MESTGFVYKFIEGCDLSQVDTLPDDYFDNLLDLLLEVHNRNIVYLDMNKPDNVLLGPDGLPHLIDFQISLHLDEQLPLLGSVISPIKNVLQSCDIYHILKRKRKLQPEQLTSQELEFSRRKNFLICLHRKIATPLRQKTCQNCAQNRDCPTKNR